VYVHQSSMSVRSVQTAHQSLRSGFRLQATTLQRAFPRPRTLHTSIPRRAQYERFGGGRPSIGGGSDGRPGGPSGRPDVVTLLRRRLGGDRAVVVYGVGVGGALVYYVVQ
jgi:hypothetical protein